MSDGQGGFAASWVGELLSAIEARADDATRTAIFERCSQACTEPWARKAREVRQAVGGDDVALLLERFGQALPGGDPDLEVRGDVICWRFHGEGCPCPVSRLTAHPSLCECGTAHVRGMLEALLDRPVLVALVGSRLRGSRECTFVARL